MNRLLFNRRLTLAIVVVVVLAMNMFIVGQQANAEHATVEKDGKNSIVFFLGEKSASRISQAKRINEILTTLTQNRPSSSNEYLKSALASSTPTTTGGEDNSRMTPIDYDVPKSRTPKPTKPFKPSKCPQYMCRLACKYGFKRNANGCAICACNATPMGVSLILPPTLPSKCPQQLCRKYCKNGFLYNPVTGCRTCECKQCPTYRPCPNKCQYGYVLDAEGCNSKCECKPAPSTELTKPTKCPQQRCRLYCPYGFNTGSDGCHVCSCKQRPISFKCPLYGCRNTCPYGFKVDARGCSTCACNEKPSKPTTQCPQYRCRLACKYGFKKRENGCPMCACNENPMAIEPIKPTIDFLKPKCPEKRCRLYCPHGFKTGSNGCDICSCKEKPSLNPLKPLNPSKCPQHMCRRYCKYGFQRNANGCPICSCNEKPRTELTKPIIEYIRPRCPLQRCRLACKYGFNTGSDGCSVCSCKEKPQGFKPTKPYLPKPSNPYLKPFKPVKPSYPFITKPISRPADDFLRILREAIKKQNEVKLNTGTGYKPYMSPTRSDAFMRQLRENNPRFFPTTVRQPTMKPAVARSEAPSRVFRGRR